MNNYHLFLIRTNCVTQLAGHLLAGILALVLFFGMSATPREVRSVSPAMVHLAHAALPSTAALVATNQ
jgi:hypothetical protein